MAIERLAVLTCKPEALATRVDPALTKTPVAFDTRPLFAPATTCTPLELDAIPLPATTNTPEVFEARPLFATTAIASAETLTPLPAPTARDKAPDVPPPVRPSPAVTAVISPS